MHNSNHVCQLGMQLLVIVWHAAQRQGCKVRRPSVGPALVLAVKCVHIWVQAYPIIGAINHCSYVSIVLQETHFKYYKFIVLWNGRWEFHGLTGSWSAPECNHRGNGNGEREVGRNVSQQSKTQSLYIKHFVCLKQTKKSRNYITHLYRTWNEQMEWYGISYQQVWRVQAFTKKKKKKYHMYTSSTCVS